MSNPYGYVTGQMGGMNAPMMGNMSMMSPPPPPPSGLNDRSMMNPATNNEPLQFNMNKGKPPLAVSGGRGEMGMMAGMDEASMQQMQALEMSHGMGADMDLERGEENGGMRGGGMMAPADGSMMGAGWQSMMGGPNMMIGSMTDPSMMMGNMAAGMGAWGGNMMGMGSMDMMAPREPIVFPECTLYPPPPTAPPPTTRERPPGCRTIFVGGLPENCTEEIVRQVFETFGSMTSVRVSKKKNFCHIRYDQEFSVDKALQISGYRMKIDNQDDKANTGRLHVDYAQARDDLYEWECQQRALAREMRHRQRVEQDRLRPPSPPPVVHFSDLEAQNLAERLKGDETFGPSSEILITWLDRGDCNRRTSNSFYSMVQSVNSHVRRLTNEKAIYNEDYEKMKLSFRNRLEGILRQFEQIDKVFKAAARQKAWDHFSKAQRKNIDTWKNQCQEIKHREEQEFLRERKEDEMEMSDSEDGEPSSKRKRQERAMEDAAMLQLRDENDSLKCQLEAYKNEVMLLKQELTERPSPQPTQNLGGGEKDEQIRILQQTLKGMQQQLMSSKKDLTERESSLKEKLESMEYENDKLKKSQQETLKKLEAAKKLSKDLEKNGEDEKAAYEEPEKVEEPSSSSHAFTDREARLVGLISTFLHVHPFGASIDYIASYLAKLQMKARTSELEDILEKCPSVFTLEVGGVGASIEKRWKFVAFNPF